MHFYEDMALEANYMNFERSKHSRYACAIRLEKWMNEMPVKIGKSSADSHYPNRPWWQNDIIYAREVDR